MQKIDCLVESDKRYMSKCSKLLVRMCKSIVAKISVHVFTMPYTVENGSHVSVVNAIVFYTAGLIYYTSHCSVRNGDQANFIKCCRKSHSSEFEECTVLNVSVSLVGIMMWE